MGPVSSLAVSTASARASGVHDSAVRSSTRAASKENRGPVPSGALVDVTAPELLTCAQSGGSGCSVSKGGNKSTAVDDD